MRTRYQNLRSTTALARPALGSGLPGQFYVNMTDQVIGWFDDAGAPIDLPFVKPPALADYLPLAGGTMTGLLVLSGAPTAPLNPATKAYADAIDTSIRAAFAAADTSIRNDFTAADTSIRNDFTAADAAIRSEFRGADAALSTQIAARLPIAGGTLTGLLTLSGAPTQPLHAAPKSYVDEQIAAIPTPDIPPGTIISATPPANPEPGQLWFSTVEPVGLFIWYTDADSSQWVQVSGSGGGGGGGTPTEIVQGAAGWQVVGDQLIQWGWITLTAPAVPAVVYPKPYKAGTFPSVNVTPYRESGAFATYQSATETGFLAQLWDGNTGAQIGAGGEIDWIAIGEARDEDKMPKTVGTASGADFATPAEAIAGVVTDKVMSPALVRALSGIMDSPSLAGQTGYTFTGIPSEATEIDVLPQFIGSGVAGQSFAFYPNDLRTNYVSSQQRIVHNAAAQWVVESTNGFFVTYEAASDNVTGIFHLIRSANGIWHAEGTFRLNTTRVVRLVGTLQAQEITRVSISSGGGAFVNSNPCRLKWRI